MLQLWKFLFCFLVFIVFTVVIIGVIFFFQVFSRVP